MILGNSLFQTEVLFNTSPGAVDTGKNVAPDAGKGTVDVKWNDNAGKYVWHRTAIGRTGWATLYSTADAVINWIRNTNSLTSGMGVNFLSLAPSDTTQPIDCEMFAWGSWRVWSDWSDCVDGTQTRTRTKTRSSKRSAAHGGTPCPTDLVQTDTQTQNCGTSGRSDDDDDNDNGITTDLCESVICSDLNRDEHADDEPLYDTSVKDCCGECSTGYEEDDNGECQAVNGDDEETPWLLYGGVGLAALVGLIILKK